MNASLRLSPLFLFVLAFVASAQADGLILNGVSARSLGRGGTNLGFADNGAMLHDNPAAMTNMVGSQMIDIGGVLLLTDFSYSEPGTSDSDTALCPLPQFAYIRKTPDEIWAYGIGVFAPAGFSANYNLEGLYPYTGTRNYKSFGALVKVLPGLACQVTESLSIGGTFGLGISHAELEGPYALNGPTLGATRVLFDTQGTGAAPVWSLGMQYLLSDDTTLGVTYTSASDFNLDGNTLVEISSLLPVRYDTTLEVTWPQSVGVGMKHALSGGRNLSADVIWYDWSSAFDQFALTLTEPNLPFFPPAIQENFPLHWRDSVSVRLGYEQQVFETNTFRCGYVYHRSPVPDSTLTPFIQATMEHAVSAGYGWNWNDWQVDASYMFLFGPDRHVTNSALLGGDFNNSDHHANVHAMALSLIRPF